jgi:hypothetical protein
MPDRFSTGSRLSTRLREYLCERAAAVAEEAVFPD